MSCTEELQGISLGQSKPNIRPATLPKFLKHSTTNIPTTTISVKFICPEFTSLCPMTETARLCHHHTSAISRISKGGKQIPETLSPSASRNHGDFHEDCVNIIHERPDRPDGSEIHRSFGELTARRHRRSSFCQLRQRQVLSPKHWARKRLFEHDSQ